MHILKDRSREKNMIESRWEKTPRDQKPF